ncbi:MULTISPECIES: flagellar hook capping FlgD N-terminal domain-containing protein [Xanthomonas translucens group]|jgi:flagellar basal-body rod modification protein FlgD|uniref:Basal-body rod modification protein FlgD n=5 Tax=Xanthomonas translucens group TaxID=3390202 RepID=A0A0K3A0P4_9XANT|nr:flagellar hook capping FlgD N-terminal domain-containing protein [Xanthomonas translucens]AKK67829.1 flagellar basal body rod modification protein [Xanthomonas translucens pv. undulosa]AVY66785.1 flagellar basal body rod modification protein [Xanthomonas translucens pv. undulosa]ELQ15349.1 flagellar basal body rod modification protein [Xanthomonas translucens DAR61454]MBC3971897.1 flagellar hook assembly protein FlgD [Xanthomonas translucens pv. undulosa]MCC8445581.1 flagellar hook assembly
MSTVSNDIYSSLGLTGASAGKTTANKSSSLNQADFLKLMTEQLQHQDPLKPMDNSQMVSQMAQLSTVQGIGDLNKTVTALSSSMSSDQILRGAQLVGHKVLVPSATMPLGSDGGANGVIAAPGAGIVNLTVSDANGNAVKQISVNASKAGEVNFSWDGTNSAGTRLPPGTYGVSATLTDSKGTNTALSTYVQAPVESATIGSDGIYLDLTGLGTAPLANVLRVS